MAILQVWTGEYQWRPYFPDLLKQPRLLVIPEPRKLVAVYIYALKRSLTWQFALAALEDLFEIKISLGEKTVVIGIALGTPVGDGETVAMSGLLHNTFDAFLVGSDFSSNELRQHLPMTIIDARANRSHFYIWNAEREHMQAALNPFNELQLRSLVSQENRSTMEKGALVPFVRKALHKLGFEALQLEPLFVSIKSVLGNLKGMHRLRFDLKIPGQPATLIEVVQSERCSSREKLRYLMAKARLVRYEVSSQGIERTKQAPRLILLLDGNLSGPDHDPFRYVRALLSVGWTVIRIDQIDLLPRMLDHAHI